MDSVAMNSLIETQVKTGTDSMDVDMTDAAKHFSNLTILFTQLKTDTDGMDANASNCSKLLDQGLSIEVADKLDDMLKTGKLTSADIDEHVIKTLKQFPTDGALEVLSQFAHSNVDNMWYKSAYLCGMLKKYRMDRETSTINTPSRAVKRSDGKNENVSGCSKDEKACHEKHDSLPSGSKSVNVLKGRSNRNPKVMKEMQRNEAKYPGKLGTEYFLVKKYATESRRIFELLSKASTTEMKAKYLRSYIDVKAKHYKHFNKYYRLNRERELKKLKELQSKMSC